MRCAAQRAISVCRPIPRPPVIHPVPGTGLRRLFETREVA